MNHKKLISMTILSTLIACGYKPFQPAPPMYKTYKRAGATEQETKDSMLECGYPNIYGGMKDDTENDVARRENCMFRKKFKYNDEYRGICSLPGKKEKLPACRSDGVEK